MSSYRESEAEIPPGLPLGAAQIAAYDSIPSDIGELPFGSNDEDAVLWLANYIGDHVKLSLEAQKVSKLIELAEHDRPAPSSVSSR